MKKNIFATICLFINLVIMIALFSPGCSQIEPIAEDVCEITTEICDYASVICEQFNNKNLTETEKLEIKSDLMEVKKLLQTKIENMESESSLRQGDKEKYLSTIKALKRTTHELTKTIENNSEIAKE